jgi:hypothetical protein
MSIEKKSLISTLKTTKKANVASSDSAPKMSTMTNKRSRAVVLQNKRSRKGLEPVNVTNRRSRRMVLENKRSRRMVGPAD